MALISAISEDAVGAGAGAGDGAGACNGANLYSLALFFRHSPPNELSRGTAAEKEIEREREREIVRARGNKGGRARHAGTEESSDRAELSSAINVVMISAC